jgi:predicted RNA methylase
VFSYSVPPADPLTELIDPDTLDAVVATLVGEAATSTRTRLGELDLATPVAPLAKRTAASIRAGFDPLGSAYCRTHSALARRAQGQTFTPLALIEGMFAWAQRESQSITRIVDPGAGSGRFVLHGLRSRPAAIGVAVEKDPALARILRANAAVLGVADRLTVTEADYRDINLAPVTGPTLFIGNPPYVRHHDIEPARKAWYSRVLAERGHTASQLAGLHLHFFVKTLELARPGDLGSFVTAAEWLDVKYGQALRDLLANGLGGRDIYAIDPRVQVFDDALVSAAVTCFKPGATEALRFHRLDSVDQLGAADTGVSVPREEACREKSWSVLVRGARRERPAGHIELGELFNVHRGQVTGLNRVWVYRPDSPPLPAGVLFPSVTDAKDITQASDGVLDSSRALRSVVDLPTDLNALGGADREQCARFLDWARTLGADATYIARHRHPWWRVRLRDPAPIVMTYMGRRPPAFARNLAGARLINVAHGIYPRRGVTIDDEYLDALVRWLNRNVLATSGRIYAGGLTKFEPSEVMRLAIPAVGATAESRDARA